MGGFLRYRIAIVNAITRIHSRLLGRNVSVKFDIDIHEYLNYRLLYCTCDGRLWRSMVPRVGWVWWLWWRCGVVVYGSKGWMGMVVVVEVGCGHGRFSPVLLDTSMRMNARPEIYHGKYG